MPNMCSLEVYIYSILGSVTQQWGPKMLSPDVYPVSGYLGKAPPHLVGQPTDDFLKSLEMKNNQLVDKYGSKPVFLTLRLFYSVYRHSTKKRLNQITLQFIS